MGMSRYMVAVVVVAMVVAIVGLAEADRNEDRIALMAELRKSAVRIAVTLKAGLGPDVLSQRSILCGNVQEGERHYICDMGKVRRSEYYNLGSNQHVKNTAFTLQQVAQGIAMERTKLLVQIMQETSLLEAPDVQKNVLKLREVREK